MRFTKFIYMVVTIMAISLLGLGHRAGASERAALTVAPTESQFELPVTEMVGTAYLAIISGPDAPIVTIPMEYPGAPEAAPLVTKLASWCETIDIRPSAPATEIVTYRR